MPHSESDKIRLIIQELENLGFPAVAKQLESEAGVLLCDQSVAIFQLQILTGKWDKIQLNSILSPSHENYDEITFMINVQRFRELLVSDKIAAFKLLKSHVAPFSTLGSEPSISFLASLLFKTSAFPPPSRQSLLESIKKYFPSNVMMPDHRLETLLDQAIDLQVSKCLYHSASSAPTSLLYDHVCSKDDFPRKSTHVFSEHTDEVWFITFSHSGTRIASASKDGTAIVWDVLNVKATHVLAGHKEAISVCQFSPNDSYLLTASNDKTLKTWHADSGSCHSTFARHTDLVSSCAWVTNETFLSGSVDKYIYLWNLSGDLLYRWSGIRVHDLNVARDGNSFLAVTEKKILRYSLVGGGEDEELKLLDTIVESDPITSVFVGKDPRYALVSLSTQEIHLWDLTKGTIAKRYIGHKQGRFVIRSCFGGENDDFVLSGSDDSRIYVWHRNRGTLLEHLEGHAGCVNCVAWNPSANMFASASDDYSVRVWVGK